MELIIYRFHPETHEYKIISGPGSVYKIAISSNIIKLLQLYSDIHVILQYKRVWQSLSDMICNIIKAITASRQKNTGLIITWSNNSLECSVVFY